MPGQTTERDFEACVEEIPLTPGGWKCNKKAAVERRQEYCTPLITDDITVKIDVRNTAKKNMKGTSDEN